MRKILPNLLSTFDKLNAIASGNYLPRKAASLFINFKRLFVIILKKFSQVKRWKPRGKGGSVFIHRVYCWVSLIREKFEPGRKVCVIVEVECGWKFRCWRENGWVRSSRRSWCCLQEHRSQPAHEMPIVFVKKLL